MGSTWGVGFPVTVNASDEERKEILLNVCIAKALPQRAANAWEQKKHLKCDLSRVLPPAQPV